MPTSEPESSVDGSYDLPLFCVLACFITWATNLPWASACATRTSAPPYALPLIALGAFGPTFAATALAARRGALSGVFGRWHTRVCWVVLALFMSPIALHLPATLLEVALGGEPAQWFYPPLEPERVAGLLVFSVGEEFGWRGYAYPRFVRQYGPVLGNLLLGAVWGLWHYGMMFTPERGAPALSAVLSMMLHLALGSVVWAWLFEKGERSMAVAIALHVGAHLDNVSRAPATEVRLEALRLGVLFIAAACAACALLRERVVRPSTRTFV